MLIKTISVLSHVNLVSSSSRKKENMIWILVKSLFNLIWIKGPFNHCYVVIKVLQIYVLFPQNCHFHTKKKMNKKKHLHGDVEMGTESALGSRQAHRAAACAECSGCMPSVALPCGLPFLTGGLLVLSGYEECCLVFEMNKFCPGYIFKHCGKAITVK